MSGFEREFIIHLQSVDEHNANGLPKRKGRKEPRRNVYQRLKRKYRKQWWGSGPVKKKSKYGMQDTKEQKDDILPSRGEENWMDSDQASWSQFNSRSHASNSSGVHEGRKYDPSLMNSETYCNDFPIAGIVQEFSGNRDNGNSPFNSSNSCGSPEGLTSQEQSQVMGKQVSASSVTDNQSCSEQNNNSQINGYTCKEDKQCTESQLLKVPDLPLQQTLSTEVIVTSEEMKNDQTGEKHEYDECKDSSMIPIHDSVVVSEPKILTSSEDRKTNDNPHTKSRSTSRRKSVSTPIAWQQQFMSFLSTAQEEECFPSDDPEFVCHIDVSPSKIQRRQRSRNVRNSSCSCCTDAESHVRKERQSRQREKKLLREQKRFIEDMCHLVSLRNKIVKLVQTLLPENLKHIIKAETDSVDDFVEFFLHIIRSTSRDRDIENKEFQSTEIGSPSQSRNEDECMDDEMPVLENCTAYVSNISSPPPVSKFQSLSDSGIVQDQSFTCEATCETISVSVDFSDDQMNTCENVLDENSVIPDDFQYLGTKLNVNSNESRTSCDALDGTHVIVKNEAEGETMQEKNIASLCDKETTSVKPEPSICDSASFDHVGEEGDLKDTERNKVDSEDKTEVKSSSDSAGFQDQDQRVLDKLDSVLHDSESKRNLSSRSDPFMDLLADKTCDETSESKCECAIQNSAAEVDTLLDDLTCDVKSTTISTDTDQSSGKLVEVFEPAIVLCKKPKKCLKLFMKKIHSLLHRLLPGVHFEHHFFRNSNNLEYLLDAIIQSNQEELSVDV
ncbi:uncharacterized protein LOC125670718 isoform X3 [Ostrea edulis]|nr:uncharacterized protein LOC125670718 isoform X3 [Ostrea edulis]